MRSGGWPILANCVSLDLITCWNARGWRHQQSHPTIPRYLKQTAKLTYIFAAIVKITRMVTSLTAFHRTTDVWRIKERTKALRQLKSVCGSTPFHFAYMCVLRKSSPWLVSKKVEHALEESSILCHHFFSGFMCPLACAARTNCSLRRAPIAAAFGISKVVSRS